MSNPEMTPVESSNVASVGYDAATKEVYVEFLAGTVYKYKDVPQGIYDQLLHADSVGGFLCRSIKNKYAFERVS